MPRAIREEVRGVSDPASLSNLRDIVEPAAVSLWPPAPGLVLLGSLLLVWIVYALLLWRRRWQANAYRRQALGELSAIEAQIGDDRQCTEGLRRLSALGYLSAHPSVETVRLLRDYTAWEQQPMLRRRAEAIARRMEAKLG